MFDNLLAKVRTENLFRVSKCQIGSVYTGSKDVRERLSSNDGLEVKLKIKDFVWNLLRLKVIYI